MNIKLRYEDEYKGGDGDGGNGEICIRIDSDTDQEAVSGEVYDDVFERVQDKLLPFGYRIGKHITGGFETVDGSGANVHEYRYFLASTHND